jgi:hypothetical protein
VRQVGAEPPGGVQEHGLAVVGVRPKRPRPGQRPDRVGERRRGHRRAGRQRGVAPRRLGLALGLALPAAAAAAAAAAVAAVGDGLGGLFWIWVRDRGRAPGRRARQGGHRAGGFRGPPAGLGHNPPRARRELASALAPGGAGARRLDVEAVGPLLHGEDFPRVRVPPQLPHVPNRPAAAAAAVPAAALALAAALAAVGPVAGRVVAKRARVGAAGRRIAAAADERAGLPGRLEDEPPAAGRAHARVRPVRPARRDAARFGGGATGLGAARRGGEGVRWGAPAPVGAAGRRPR